MLVPSLAFLFSSADLVIELGIILYLLFGWQFTATKWVGGVVLVAISEKVVPGRHAALRLDQAGWHVTPKDAQDVIVMRRRYYADQRAALRLDCARACCSTTPCSSTSICCSISRSVGS